MHVLLPVVEGGSAIESAVGELSIDAVVFEDVEEGGELREDENFVFFFEKFFEEFVEHF